MPASITVQMPASAPRQLFLLFHGVGGAPQNLVPLGQRLALEFPQAAVVCVAGPEASDLGAGFQWFSVQGISEDNRAQRIADTMPRFVATVRGWQQRTGLTHAETALVGFSQGSIMALESTQLGESLAGRVVALSGRFAQLPEQAPATTTLHFIHGKNDEVVPYGHTVAAAERLVRLGGDITADVIPFLGHTVNEEVVELLVERLKGHIPKRIWEQAGQSAPPQP